MTKKPNAQRIPPKPTERITFPDSEEEDESSDGFENLTKEIVTGRNNQEESGEDLEDDPLISKPATKRRNTTAKPNRPAPAKRKAPVPQQLPPRSVSPEGSSPPLLPSDRPAEAAAQQPIPPSQSEGVPVLPQPLLVRLLHEHFADKSTKIDKHAIQVVQKYVEVFVREAIARTELLKKEAADKGHVSEMDGGWLELEDLEKAAPGLLLDF